MEAALLFCARNYPGLQVVLTAQAIWSRSIAASGSHRLRTFDDLRVHACRYGTPAARLGRDLVVASGTRRACNAHTSRAKRAP